MKKLCVLSAMIVLVAGGAAIQAEPNKKTLVVTSSNRATNELLVYSTSGALVQTVPTGGQGGVGANAGGVAASNGTVAVVNFGSQTVSIFDQGAAGFEWRQTISTATPPVRCGRSTGPCSRRPRSRWCWDRSASRSTAASPPPTATRSM